MPIEYNGDSNSHPIPDSNPLLPFSDKNCLIRRFSVYSIVPFFWLICLLIGCGENRDTLHAKAAESLKNNDIDAAKRWYESILQQDPFDAVAIQGMVDATRLSNATDEHNHWCRELLRLRPWDRYANIVYGKQLMKEGDLENAVTRFILAYQDSEFKQDKKDVLNWIEKARAAELARQIEAASPHITSSSPPTQDLK
ncbi:MAG: hypothetical protein C4527_11255 [Candidatus Omnitrophota bacterium]|jgi:tetratricopeptide (TPR) repeat protein|nr:MAG: hypothetical protein C4527_11255 [Candidatus Omnitrophota bacterium]